MSNIVITELTAAERQESLLGDRQTHPVAPTGIFNRMHMVGVARVRMGTGRARPWRITLSRLDRVDGAFMAQGHDTLYPGENYQYLFGVLPIPTVPPRRTNPIYGNLDPSNGAFLQDNWVEIAWGTQAGGAPSRLLAQWPSCGASLVVSGSYVEVWGAGAIQIDGSPPTPPGSLPLFQATIDPVDGVSPGDAGSELSLTEVKAVQEPAAGGLLATADNFTSFPFSTDPAVPGSSLRGSAVVNVAPFSSWSAVLRRFNSPSRTNPIVRIKLAGNMASVLVLDNVTSDRNGNESASPGNVLIRINQTTAPTFAAIEAAINAQSSIIQVATPSANPAFVVPTLTEAMWVSPGPGGIAGVEMAAAPVIPPVTEGAVFYVPDFARRVRVVLTQGNDSARRVPLIGDPQCQVVFWDDRGFAVDMWRQGLVLQAAAIVGNDSPVWHPVPDSAVLMSVFSDPAVTTNIAQVHWRIAP